MATVASCGVASGDVIWDRSAERGCTLPCRCVTAVASRIRGRQGVVVVGMALIASCARQVVSGQRPARHVVIELAVGPFRDWMARRTHSRAIREPCCYVVRHRTAERRGTDPRRRVAVHTVGGAQSVIVIGMACGAGRRRG